MKEITMADSYTKSKFAISLSNHERTALFFEKVIPVDVEGFTPFWLQPQFPSDHFFRSLIVDSTGGTEVETLDVFDRMLREPYFRLNDLVMEMRYCTNDYTDYWYRMGWLNRDTQFALQKLMEIRKVVSALEGPMDRTILLSLAYIYNLELDYFGSVRQHLLRLSKTLGFTDYSVIVDPVVFRVIEGATDEDLSVSLIDIPMLDTSSISYDKILEARKDERVMSKLRNLRLFFHKNFSDKPKSLVEDELMRIIDEYESACDSMEFERKMGFFKTVIDSKNMQVAAVGGLMMALFGEPIIGTAALLGGVSVEVGKALIEFRKKEYAFNLMKEQHDLAYLFYLKQQSEESEKESRA